MKIFRYPHTYTESEKHQLFLDLMKVTEEGEHWIILPDNIKITELSLEELYEIKEEIEDAIHDHEVISNM